MLHKNSAHYGAHYGSAHFILYKNKYKCALDIVDYHGSCDGLVPKCTLYFPFFLYKNIIRDI